MPIYLNIDSALQIFMSQQSINEFLALHFKEEGENAQTNFTEFAIKSDALDNLLPGFAKTFGSGLSCFVGVRALN